MKIKQCLCFMLLVALLCGMGTSAAVTPWVASFA